MLSSDFHCKENDGTIPVHPVIMMFMKSLFVEISMSWLYGYDLGPIIFLTMKM